MTLTNQPSGTVTNQPSGKKSKKTASTTAPNRLPSTRERRPALAALAVLLIAGGAVLAGWLSLRQSQTESYLQTTDTILEGQRIEPGDIESVELPKEGVNAIPASQEDDVVGSFAQMEIPSGSILNPVGMLGDRPDLGVGQSHIGLDLEAGQYPPGLTVGDRVNVLELDGSSQGGLPLTETPGTVTKIDPAETGSGAEIEVVMSAKCAARYGSASTADNVALVEISPRDDPVECDTR